MSQARVQARGMWHAIAKAEFDRRTLLWVANIAVDIVKADQVKDDNRRRAAIVEATGLAGRLDESAATIRAVVASVDHTCMLIERGSKWCAPRKLKRGELRSRRREAVAEALNLVESPSTIDKRISRALSSK